MLAVQNISLDATPPEHWVLMQNSRCKWTRGKGTIAKCQSEMYLNLLLGLFGVGGGVRETLDISIM